MKRLIALLFVIGLSGFLMMPTGASSHREAPLISGDPRADNTDVYAFVSPDQPGTVTIIATYIPLQEPAGGPNFNAFDDNVLYEIHVDNDGNARDDVTYQFRFRTKVRHPNSFLYNTGPIDSLDDTDWNMPQSYRVTELRGRSFESLGTRLPTPPVNIGPRSTPAYDLLRAAAVHTLSNGVKVFAGQVDDPFFVDLGSIFDLAGLRPFNPAHIIPLAAGAGVDGVGGYNTHAIALQIPIIQLTRDGQLPTGPTDPDAVLGIYASASRRTIWVDDDDRDDDDRDDWERNGHYVQVSRLGNPLINEVVIPLGQKDRWNRSDPREDERFLRRYTSPEVTRLENLLYPVLDNAPETERGDLVAVLLTGVPGLNFTGGKTADLLRLNTGIPPTNAVGLGNRLGVLAGDFAGFPNGRRLEDDVTDIDLRAFACGYGGVVGPLIESFGFCAGNANRSPNNLLGDGVDANDRPFTTEFPYLATPHQGYEHGHH